MNDGSTFQPCPSRIYDFKDGVIYGCLLDAADGHAGHGGLSHRNNGHRWSSRRQMKTPRCTSTYPTSSGVRRCVAGVGHYPKTVHNLGAPSGWTDEMACKPPKSTPTGPPVDDTTPKPGRKQVQAARVEALRQAVAWASTRRGVSDEEFSNVVARFERYLTDGTAVTAPLNPAMKEKP